MKRLLLLLVAMMMCIALSGCSGPSEGQTNQGATETAVKDIKPAETETASPEATATPEPNVVISGNWGYVELENGTVEIVGGRSLSDTVEIPEELDGKKVTGIWGKAFDQRPIKRILIPDSVTNLKGNPFTRCYILTEIVVSPDHPSLALIDGVLFSKPDKRLVCYPCGLTETKYAIPKGIKIIGDNAFESCQRLTEIIIPESATNIGNCAFYNDSKLTEISIPDGVTSIGDHAFFKCASLTRITIPDGVKSIEVALFAQCEKLTEIIIPNGVTNIGASAFSGCKSLKEVTVPDGVTNIGDGSFFGCESLTEITIPDGVTSIEEGAFGQCKALTEITIPNSVTRIGARVFSGCTSLTEITIPDGVTSIENRTFRSCPSLNKIIIPDSVTSIGDKAFDSDNHFTLIVGRNSYAEKYCKENNLKYSYTDANDWLND